MKKGEVPASILLVRTAKAPPPLYKTTETKIAVPIDLLRTEAVRHKDGALAFGRATMARAFRREWCDSQVDSSIPMIKPRDDLSTLGTSQLAHVSWQARICYGQTSSLTN